MRYVGKLSKDAEELAGREVYDLCAERDALAERVELAVTILDDVGASPGCCDRCEGILQASRALRADDDET